MIEPLESRTLLSHGIAPLASVRAPSSSATAVFDDVTSTGSGPTLNAVAGISLTAQLGYVQSSLGSGLNISTSIQWGDATPASGASIAGTTLTSQGYPVVATHTYAQPGRYEVEAQVFGTPVVIPGQPTPDFIAILGTLYATVIVTAGPIGAPTGTPVTATAGQPFNATLGSFSTAVPAARLRATVEWGDGKTSTGVLTALSTTDANAVNFSIAAGHRYQRAGTFALKIVVHRRGATGKASLIDTLHSMATIASSPTAADGV